MQSYILCGMQYGDEGKGSFVDYLTHKVNAKCVVKYNGGSQASHTVVCPNGTTHRFAQLGSGMFKDDCETYITENMVVNPQNLMREIEQFAKETSKNIGDIIPRIHIHKDCCIVTEYHKLINRMRELASGDERRGSVGTGVSEVYRLVEESDELYKLYLTMDEVYSEFTTNHILTALQDLKSYAYSFYKENEDKIWSNCDKHTKKDLLKMMQYLFDQNAIFNVLDTQYRPLIETPNELSLKTCLYDSYEHSIRNHNVVIWEGSQGLLIDKNYGVKPNTTYLDTTNNFALDIAYLKDEIKKIGIIKAFCSRHGMGIFPTKDEELSEKIIDAHQDWTVWNGKPEYGWFDIVLLKYAQSINNVDELYISCLDQLSGLKEIKVCTKYKYNGIIDDEFKKIFGFYIDVGDSNVYITNILKNHTKLKEYLLRCEPIYITCPGWDDKKNISKICDYIHLLEKLICVKITVGSTGATREDKIEIEGC